MLRPAAIFPARPEYSGIWQAPSNSIFPFSDLLCFNPYLFGNTFWSQPESAGSAILLGP